MDNVITKRSSFSRSCYCNCFQLARGGAGLEFGPARTVTASPAASDAPSHSEWMAWARVHPARPSERLRARNLSCARLAARFRDSGDEAWSRLRCARRSPSARLIGSMGACMMAELSCVARRHVAGHKTRSCAATPELFGAGTRQAAARGPALITRRAPSPDRATRLPRRERA